MQLSGTVTAALAAAGLLILGDHAVAGPVGRAWVSGHGTDHAGCGAPTAPCRSLQYAHDNVVIAGGEIDILDPAGYGAITITKSISIVNDGVGTAGVQSASGIAININAGPTDSIYLRGLNVDGVNYAGATGIQFNTGASLTIVNSVVRHFVNYGIALAPTGSATRINLSDTTSSDNHGGGILLRPPSGTFRTDLVINRATAQDNSTDGLSIDGGATSASVSAYTSDSNFSNNLGDGVKIQNHVSITIDRSQLDHNAIGVEALTNSRAFLSNSSFNGNSTQDLLGDPSCIVSYGTNFWGSSSPGITVASPH